MMLLHGIELIESVRYHLVFSLDYITLDLRIQDRCDITYRCVFDELAIFMGLIRPGPAWEVQMKPRRSDATGLALHKQACI